jgi:hypothetical protein
MREIYHHYETSYYHSNELSSVYMFHECKLCSWSRTSEQSFASVYSAYSVSIYNILIWICEV